MAGTVRSICVAALTLLLLGIWTFLNEGTIAAETPNIGRLNTNVVITGTNLLGGSSSSISVSLAGVAVFPSSGQSGMRAFIFRHGLEDDTIFHRFHYESYLKDEVVYANTRPSSIFLLQDTLLQYTISRYSNRKKKKRKVASSRYFLIKSKRFRLWRVRRKIYQKHRFGLKLLRACSYCVMLFVILLCHVLFFLFAISTSIIEKIFFLFASSISKIKIWRRFVAQISISYCCNFQIIFPSWIMLCYMHDTNTISDIYFPSFEILLCAIYVGALMIIDTISRLRNLTKNKIQFASSRYFLIQSKRFRLWRLRRKLYQKHRFGLKLLRACSFRVMLFVKLLCHVLLFLFTSSISFTNSTIIEIIFFIFTSSISIIKMWRRFLVQISIVHYSLKTISIVSKK